LVTTSTNAFFLLDVLAQQNKLALKLKQKREERLQLLALRQQQESAEHYKKVKPVHCFNQMYSIKNSLLIVYNYTTDYFILLDIFSDMSASV
jgi:hypothetical protein